MERHDAARAVAIVLLRNQYMFLLFSPVRARVCVIVALHLRLVYVLLLVR